MNMQKGTWLLAILGVIFIILLGILVLVPGRTKAPANQLKTGLVVTLPKSGETIFSPLKITGYVNGDGWAGFEGQVGTVKLLDSNGQQIGQTAILTATTDWMTTSPVSFEASLSFVSFIAQSGILVFNNENPSDMREKDKTYSLPVRIAKSQNIEVGVFFGNQSLSSSSEQDECKRVYKSQRYIGETVAVAQAAISELLKGPTDIERAAGFFTSIPSGSKLNSISITNGVAKVDFNTVTESGGGSCSMAARVAQITQTLKQFSTVKNIIISINGRTEDIFQP